MSTIKVNTVTKRTGSTLTLGECGATVQLATGATQTGFGRTGTVDWCTTAKTSPFTAVSGDGYFVNTTSGAVTVTLPASPSAGDIVSVSDYAKTAQTNNITVGRNSSNIDGEAADLVLSTEGIATTLVYVDGTKGWKPVNSNEVKNELLYVTATGGTVTTCGDFKIHTFTSDGCFAVTCAGSASGSNKVSYTIVGGGGGGGGDGGGGGGAGGFREGKCTSDPYTASPLNAPDGLPVSVQTYPVSVAAGGGPGPNNAPHLGTNGGNSIFSTITSHGGGRGGGGGAGVGLGADGGSGAGGGRGSTTPRAGGSGNTPPVSPAQGTNGGPGGPPNGGDGSGGGGGATVAGSSNPGNVGGAGGAGATTSITGSAVAYAGGAGGGATPGPNTKSAGGTGGGGCGAGCGAAGTCGTNNKGGGGGGSTGSSPASIQVGGNGGSGVVILRYKFQN